MKLPLLLLLILATAACKDSAGPENLVGTFVLQSVNGSPLPYTTLQTAQRKEELTGITLAFSADGTYTMTIRRRITQSGSTSSATETQTGTWIETGNAVRLAPSNQATYIDAIRMRDTLSIRALGQVFRRQ